MPRFLNQLRADLSTRKLRLIFALVFIGVAGTTIGLAATGVTINNAPCTVTLNNAQQTGTCSGTFTPTPSSTPSTSPTPVLLGPTASNAMARRSSYALTLNGVTTGQPIVLWHYAWETGGVSSITSTFSTPYTWTLIESEANVSAGTIGQLWLELAVEAQAAPLP